MSAYCMYPLDNGVLYIVELPGANSYVETAQVLLESLRSVLNLMIETADVKPH